MTTDRYTRERITDSLLTAREGLVPYADACEWLTNYPDKPTAPGSPPSDSANSLARSLGGAGLLGRVLDRLHGSPPAWESRGQSADYRPSAGGTLVSVAALAEAARDAENVPLLRLIQEAQAERAAVLGILPQGVGPEPEADTVPTDPEWKAVAREVAREIDKAEAKAGRRPPLSRLGDQVAEHLRARGVHGPRGPLSGETIKRQALNGMARVMDGTQSIAPKRGK